MPLIILTGLPSSGKSTRAAQLKRLLEARIAASPDHSHMSTIIISDQDLAIPKDQYRESRTEKAIRGAQMSAVKRHLSQSCIVIFDNLSYIKGFRYQLFCEAKALRTNSCVVQVGPPVDMCKKFNQARPLQEQWPADLFDQLVFRYEEPNPMSRWDSPLFAVAHDDVEAPIEDIWAELILRQPKPANQATVLKPAAPANYLSELDRVTQVVISEALALHKVNPGGRVKLRTETVDLPPVMSVPQINRSRRAFIALNKMKPVEVSRIERLFVEFLQREWQSED